MVQNHKFKSIHEIIHSFPLANEIDHTTMLELNDDIVKELIPKVGPRIKFLKLLKSYQLLNKTEIITDDNESDTSLLVVRIIYLV